MKNATESRMQSQDEIKRVLFVAGEDIGLRSTTFEYFKAKGIEVFLAAPNLDDKLAEKGFQVHLYDLKRGVNLFADLKALGELRKLTIALKPDIVHAFDTKPCYLLPIALIGLRGPKVVRTINGMGKIFSSSSPSMNILKIVYTTLHRLSKKRVDFTIFQNDDDQQYFLNKKLVKKLSSDLIPGSGIDVGSLRSAKNQETRHKLRKEMKLDDKIVFIMVARLVEQKGVMEFLEASKILNINNKRVKCILVGPSGGSEPDGISEDIIAQYSECVDYLGSRSDVPELLNASDIFVLPTKYREGVPRSMLEAMGMGLPVIVSDMPGCKEAVFGRDSGRVIPPSDVSALSLAMEEMLTADLEQMGGNGLRDIKEKYEHTVVMDALEGVYREL